MAATQSLRALTLTALQSWPKDPLRPANAQLGNVLSSRLQKEPQQPSAHEEQQAAAIRSLLANRFTERYAFDPETSASGGMLTPRSNPEYYNMLIHELEEGPKRSFFQRLAVRLKGMFRMDE